MSSSVLYLQPLSSFSCISKVDKDLSGRWFQQQHIGKAAKSLPGVRYKGPVEPLSRQGFYSLTSS